ncbi:MAG: PilT/PilU family type 4a pilus ATPase [Candidatus Nanopelagicales bacterium]
MSTEVWTVDSLLGALWDAGGTDLHLSAMSRPLIRVHMDLIPLAGTEVMKPAEIERLARELLTDEQLDDCRRGHDVDFSFGWRGQARIRGNAYRQRNTVALALRIMPHTIPSFDDLGIPMSVRELAAADQGLILVTGPTGSGKSTTLATMLDWIAANRAVHIITIEDPIEYVHSHQKAAVHQRAVGEDTESFAAALRSALREDPDVILVGELRDLESIRFALTLAETGHLVLATVHTNDTAQTMDRLVEVFPGDEQSQIRTQLALSLKAVVYQRLLPRRGGGLVAAYEVLKNNSSIRNLIKEGRTNQLRNQLIMGRKEGMMSLEDSLSDLVQKGLVDYEQAAIRSQHPNEVAKG